MNTNQAWLMVPISTVDSGAGKDRTPSGFWTAAETPPGAGSCTFFGWTRNPIKVSAMSSRHSPPTGRHRGDGRCPVGKSRNMNATLQISGKNDHSASTPAIAGPGRVPGCLTPSTAYAEKRATKPSAIAREEQVPPDDVARTADDQRPEAGIQDGRRHLANRVDRVAGDQVLPGEDDQDQGGSRDRGGGRPRRCRGGVLPPPGDVHAARRPVQTYR